MNKAWLQLGMSMVEGMIAFTLLAVGALAALNMDKLNFEQLGLAAGSSQTLEIIQHAHSTLQDLTACSNTLGARVPGAGGSIPGIKDSFGNTFTELNKTYDGIRVQDIKLRAPDLSRGTYSAPGQTGLIELEFIFQNMKKKVPTDILRRFKVWVLTDGSGAIVKCHSPVLLSTSLWQTSPTRPEDIYYAAGEVGVGLNNPTVELDVNGRARFATIDNQTATIGKGGTSPRIELAVNRPFGVLQSNGSRADILLNDLLLSDVAQLMGFSSGVLPCTPSIEGALRYNSTINSFQFCGGDKWRSIVNVP
jgi:hypothetical protein